MDDLAGLFDSVAERLGRECSALNQADPVNGNHGDHMLAIFQVATQAARQIAGNDLASAMELASQSLLQMENNASAQLYALGLQQFAAQFRRYEVGFDRFEDYVRSALSEEKGAGPKDPKSGEVLKALVNGLSDWQAASQAEPGSAKGMELGYLFDLGVAYLQARQSAANKLEALAETAVSVSPLGKTPHRAQSGKLVIITLLQSLQLG